MKLFQGLHLVGFVTRFHSLDFLQKREDRHARSSLMRNLGINSFGKDGEEVGMGRETAKL